MQHGAFGRAVSSLVHDSTEGGLDKLRLAKIDFRLSIFEACKPMEFDRHVRSITKCVDKYKDHELRQFQYYFLYPALKGILTTERFNHIMLLQHEMLLLGAFHPDPVPHENIDQASELLKLYIQICNWGWQIRFTRHQIMHLVEDVKFYQCGIECLSTYVFENFQKIFLQMLRSGYLEPEQIRNRCIEIHKYALPTGHDHMIITNALDCLKIEAAKLEVKEKNCNVVLEFIDRNELGKLLKFPQFSLTNVFPDNMCMLKNGNVIVCTNFSEEPEGSGIYVVSGFKFRCLEDCYSEPFLSSKFGIFFGSKIDTFVTEWNVNNISAKMSAIPYMFGKSLPKITDPKSKWYLSSIFHTLNA